ncbi:permease prefix domain 1-containing protein [Bacillus sp. FJAT-50079]|uniref:permease prefix domain 1-containing protein n=1 Tax=Bacillus sp. FJAT-50079 TaxID=2833577 RepID=UPI001BC90616|nr:permease prefix domain 1-containing protein [Bacillus sp. FJAT-50079]MBS4209924.1 hypothetical protein [Bacillus sp. FJAT-50079]
MNATFRRFVEKIVQQTDASPDEKEDLYEELLIHLELSYEQQLKEGYSEQEAESRALKFFGDEENIGSQIQQAMFPYRKEMILILAFASILFSVSVYVSQLVVDGNAVIAWLLISMSVSTSLLFFSLRPIPFLNRRLWLNSLLLIHLFTYLFGVGFASSVDALISAPLTILAWGILLLTLVLIYRTTILDYQSYKQKYKKQIQIFHALNITWGIIIICATLFFIWALLAFSGGMTSSNFLIFVPLFIWMVAYIAQILFLSKEMKKSAYVVAIIPFILVVTIVLWFLWGIIG